MRVVTGEEMKKIDQYTIDEIGMDGTILMENAGRKSAERIIHHYPDKRFCVLIGSGNNGGDGFVIARILKENHHDVEVCLIPEESRISGDAEYHKDIYINSGYTFSQYDKGIINNADVIIDTMLGTGVKGEIRAPYKHIFQELNKSDKIIVSVDLPSGVPGDESEVLENALKADRTIIIQLPKMSYYTFPSRENYGEVEVVEIGIPNRSINSVVQTERQVWTTDDTVNNWPERNDNSHKGSHGKVGIIAGSSNMPGAAVLTTTAAVRSGAGLTALNTHKDIFSTITNHAPEATLFDRKDDLQDFIDGKDVIGIGPGIGVNEDTRITVEYLVDNFDGSLVLDADALSELQKMKDKIKNRKNPVIISPHPGEMARLIDSSAAEVNQNRFDISREISIEYGVYLVLKGPNTLVTTPGGETFINDTGNAGLAKGGSGDVLTGMIAAFLGRYENTQHAVSSAVFMHGFTADYILNQGIGIETMIASDIVDNLSATFSILGQ